MGRSAKFTKRLTKKEKDSVRVVSNTTSASVSKGYLHDSKETLKKAAKALGDKAKLKSGGVKTTLGPSGGLSGGLSDTSTQIPSISSAYKHDSSSNKVIETTSRMSLKQKRSEEKEMDLDIPIQDLKQRNSSSATRPNYVTQGLDYVNLFNSRNPKKLLQKLDQ